MLPTSADRSIQSLGLHFIETKKIRGRGQELPILDKKEGNNYPIFHTIEASEIKVKNSGRQCGGTRPILNDKARRLVNMKSIN